MLHAIDIYSVKSVQMLVKAPIFSLPQKLSTLIYPKLSCPLSKHLQLLPCSFNLWHVAHISQKAVKRKLEDVGGGNVKEEESPSKWLIKSEPEARLENGVDVSFSFEALKKEPASTACWDGVRNYSARNHMRAMKVGFSKIFCNILILLRRLVSNLSSTTATRRCLG